jgi:hypothetical protein
MQEVLVKIGSQDSQKEKQRYQPGKSIAEFPQDNCYAQMPERYKNYAHPANVVVWGWKNSCRKEQVPDCDDPVCDDN